MTAKKTKLTKKQVRVRAEAIRSYGISNYLNDTGIPRGTLNTIISGFRDSSEESCRKQSKATGIPLEILNPAIFSKEGVNGFLEWMSDTLELKRISSTPEQWEAIVQLLKTKRFNDL